PIPSSGTNNYGQVGFTNNTILPQTSGVPTVTLTNPFPNGAVPPLGNSLRTLTGVGTTIGYVDQNGTAPRVQQYSIDFDRELPVNSPHSTSHAVLRVIHHSLVGSNYLPVNNNQLDPKYMALGTRLNDQLPNPFIGNAAFVGTSFYTSPTVSRAQLLRPFP